MTRFILGMQPAREAIRVHGDALTRVLFEEGAGPTVEAVARFARDRGIPVEARTRADLDRIATGGRHQGVIVIAPELRLLTLEQIAITETTLIVALDGVMDPQNFGAVIRSAVALGAEAVLWPEHSSAPLSPSTFRASAGAIEHAALCRVPALPEALTALGEKGVTAVALDAQGSSLLSDVDLRGPVVIVIGAEDKGVRRPVRRVCRYSARLPMAGPIASLNASVAGAIALYEVARQRGSTGPARAPGSASG